MAHSGVRSQIDIQVLLRTRLESHFLLRKPICGRRLRQRNKKNPRRIARLYACGFFCPSSSSRPHLDFLATKRLSRRVLDQGEISFYVLILLPIVMTMSIIAVDLSAWNALRDFAEREADRVALQAATALPDIDKAKTVIQNSFSQHFSGQHQQSISLALPPQIDRSSIKLILRATRGTVFDTFLQTFLHSKQMVFHAFIKSEVQLVPTDTVLILGDGYTLMPRLGGRLFGDPLQWPEAEYFQTVRLPKIYNPQSSEYPLVDYTDSYMRRFATQACFNPVFSTLKMAAISLVDVLGASTLNRVSVIVSPGDDSQIPYSVLRTLQGEVTTGGVVYFPDAVGGFSRSDVAQAEAYWDSALDPTTMISNESCLLFSYPQELIPSPHYQLPRTPLHFGLSHSQSALSQNTEPLSLQSNRTGSLYLAFGQISPGYVATSLKLREAIYWHAAKLNTKNNHFGSEVLPALRAGLLQLQGVGTNVTFETEKAVRGNIAAKAFRKIILLSDALPDPSDSDFDSFMSGLENIHGELIIVAFLPDSLLAGEHQQEQGISRDRLEALRNWNSHRSPQSNAGTEVLRIFEARSPEQLRDTVIPTVLSLDRQFAIRSKELTQEEMRQVNSR